MTTAAEFSQIEHIFVISTQIERQNIVNLPEASLFHFIATNSPLLHNYLDFNSIDYFQHILNFIKMMIYYLYSFISDIFFNICEIDSCCLYL